MIGIDIGSKFVKVCQVELRKGSIYDINGVIKEFRRKKGKDITFETKLEALKKITGKANFTGRRAAFAVGSPDTVLRLTEFPVLPEDELRNSIKYNAEKYIYTSLEGMDMDASILKKTKGGLNVLVAAAPSNHINENMKVVQGAKYFAEIADIDILALVNCFMKLNPDFGVKNRSAALVDCGHTATGFAIVNSEGLCFAKNIKFGGADITSRIASTLNIKKEKAEKIKRNPEVWEEAGLNIKNILRRTTPDLIENLHRAVEYCQSNRMLPSLDKIYITGGGAMVKGICSMIKEIMGIETVLWNPMDNLKGESNKSSGPMLSVAAGLALRQ